MPRKPVPRQGAGFEAWLFGDVDELGAAVEALGAAFATVTVSAREPLGTGRSRQYLRGTRPSVPPENTNSERAHEQCEIPFFPSSET